MERKDFYLDNFGFFPEFKAGIDLGFVTVTEIGDIKREIAFHGDVVNIASRIQDQCNKLDQKLLISEYPEEQLIDMDGFKILPIGEVKLVGKEKPVKLFTAELDESLLLKN